MQTVDEFMEEAFFEGRDLRSAEYRQGARDVLVSHIERSELAPSPFKLGTAQADAYLSGREEGGIIWRTMAAAYIQTFSIKDFIPEHKPPRLYENFTFDENASVAPHALKVNLDWLSYALKGDVVWAFEHAERIDSTFKPGKYHHWLPRIRNGEPIEAPYLSFNEGRVSIVDGRHRLYAFIDSGYTHWTVVVGDRALDAISTLVDSDL